MLKSRRLLLIAIACCVGMAGHADYTDTWSLPVGAQIPPISMSDQYSEAHTFQSLSGKRGLLLFFNRSADW